MLQFYQFLKMFLLSFISRPVSMQNIKGLNLWTVTLDIWQMIKKGFSSCFEACSAIRKSVSL